MTVAPARTLRKDAQRNRDVLLRSADAMIREHGIELSLNAVARHAGVGVGTVYRHFPDRDALIDALFEERVDRIAVILAGHLHDADPVDGLRAAALDICELQAVDRGLWEVVSAGSRDNHHDLVQARVLPLTEQLVSRANATGRLRTRFAAADLPMVLWTGGALTAYLGHAVPGAWRRYVELMLNGYLRDDDPSRVTLQQRSPTPDEFDAAMGAYSLRVARRSESGARRG